MGASVQSGKVRAGNRKRCLARGWAALPRTIASLTSRPRSTRPAPSAGTWPNALRELPRRHLVPAQALRPHFHSIYAYCRISDDLGDEVPDNPRPWRSLICGAVNWTLATRVVRAIPFLSRWPKPSALVPFPKSRSPICSSPFARTRPSARYATMDDVLGYCRYSANPVGRLVLYACGEVAPRRRENFMLSTPPAPRCNWQTSGRMCAWISPKTAYTFRKTTCAALASATRPSREASPRRSFAH